MQTLMLVLVLLAPRPQAAEPPALRDRIEALVRGARGMRVGILVYSTDLNQTVYAARDREAFALASNAKLLTTAAAFCRLGIDFKFRTSVGMIGGDLHVFGGGDPNISGRFHDGDPTAIFRRWAGDLKAAGVAGVRDIVLHTGIFEDAHVNPGWKDYDPGAWWAAPFGPLSLNDNCADLTIGPGAEGRPCRASLAPDTAFVTVVNRASTSAKPRRRLAVRRDAARNVITLTGEVGTRSPKGLHWIAVTDPTLFFGTVLQETLEKEGVAVDGTLRESPLAIEEVEDYTEIAFWESALVPTIAVCHGASQNFYAEMILRTLGWKLKGKGALATGLEVVREFLKDDVGLEEASPADACGLTRENLCSPAELVKLLIYMREHEAFVGSLPAGGAPETTLRNRMKEADLRGRIRAKSGHINGVSTLAGYVESKGDDTFIFAILVNAEAGGSVSGADRLEDRLCALLARDAGE